MELSTPTSEFENEWSPIINALIRHPLDDIGNDHVRTDAVELASACDTDETKSNVEDLSEGRYSPTMVLEESENDKNTSEKQLQLEAHTDMLEGGNASNAGKTVRDLVDQGSCPSIPDFVCSELGRQPNTFYMYENGTNEDHMETMGRILQLCKVVGPPCKIVIEYVTTKPPGKY